jgi:hypothetical protein
MVKKMPMSEEEKKAIKIVNSLKEWGKIHFIVKDRSYARLTYNEIYLLLNLIESQQREIKRFTRNEFKRSNKMLNLISMHSYDKEKMKNKDKIIDLMAKEILRLDTEKSKFEYDHAKMWDTEKGIKEYFIKKVGELGWK